MSVDTRILPESGRWEPIESLMPLIYSRRISDLINDSSSGFVTDYSVESAPKYRRYSGNSYTAYAGGQGYLNSRYATAVYDTSNRKINFTASEEDKIVNISLVFNDRASGNTWTGDSWHIYSESNAIAYQHDDNYLCPVTYFDPNQICFAIKLRIANWPDTESEGISWTEVDFSHIIPTHQDYEARFEGLLEEGRNDTYWIGSFRTVCYYGPVNASAQNPRYATNRIGIMIENAAKAAIGSDDGYFYDMFGCNTYTTGLYRFDDYNLSRLTYQNWSHGYFPQTGRNGDIAQTGSSVVNSIWDYNVYAKPFTGEIYMNSYPTRQITWIDGSNLFALRGRWASSNSAQIGVYFKGTDVFKIMAATGLYFTWSEADAAQQPQGPWTTSPAIHLGVIDEDGYTYGDWVSGTDCTRQKQANWVDAITGNEEDNNFTPQDPDDRAPDKPDPYSDNPESKINPYIPVFGVGEMGTYVCHPYMITAALAHFNETFYEAAQNASDNDELSLWSMRSFGGIGGGGVTDPSQCIINAIDYPFEVTPVLEKSGTTLIKDIHDVLFGYLNYHNDAWGWHKFGNQWIDVNCVIDAGSVKYTRDFNDFRDFAPYSTAEIYIPYCGSVPIDPEVFVGHTIRVKYLVDWMSGACLALVYRDNMVVDTISGQLGSRLTITTADMLNYERNVTQGVAAVKGAKTQAAIQIASGTAGSVGQFAAGNTSGAFATALSTEVNTMASIRELQAAEYAIQNIPIGYKQISTSTEKTSRVNEQKCRLVIYRPKMLESYNEELFKATTGFKCLHNNQIGAFHGYTEVSSIDTGRIQFATSTEREMIKSLLAKGVYITAQLPDENR